MNRLGRAVCVTLGSLLVAAAAEAGEGLHLQASGAPPSPASGPVARSSMIVGAALAIRTLAIWRNNMPRVLEPGQKDPGSPLIVKAEVEATGARAPVKLTWKADLVPAGGIPEPVKNLEVSVEGNPWSGELKGGAQTYIEFYSKSDSTLTPGTKAKVVLTFTSGSETVTLEQETTVERVD